MKNKEFKSIWLSLVLLILIGSTVFGQHIMSRPLKYNEPHRNIDLRPVSESERDPVQPWFIFPLSDNTPVYSEPGGSHRVRSVNFGEILWVIEEQGNFLKIAKDDRPDVFTLSNRAEIFGWIRKDDALLWRTALMDPQTKIYLKGMMMNTTRALGSTQVNYRRVQSFKDPALQIPTEYESRLFEIFHIYKYSPRHNSVLLGRSPYISSIEQARERITGNIIGWVDLDRVLEWDTRVAIEPNWNTDAVGERMQKNIRSIVFNPAEGPQKDRCAHEFSRGQATRNCDIAWQDDIWDTQGGAFERRPGYWRRFPVIGDYGRNIYEIMVMGELTSETGQRITHEVDARTRQSLNELIEQYRNINVVFVIDGTNSMGPFYQSAINSVNRIVEIIKRTGDGLKNLRFGYVVYRDYAERDRLVEVRQLTTNADHIVRELRNVKAEDLYDTFTHEAVYYGLKTAFDRVLDQRYNDTNILIHIGDAGNHYRDDPSQVPQSEIIDLMVKYKCHYIAYQAHHMSDHQAYRDFPHQIREIMSRAADRIYNEWKNMGREDIERPVLSQVRTNVHRIENGHPMLVMAAGRGQTMDLAILENEITRAIEEIDNYTDVTIELARELIERGRGIEEIITQTSDGMYVSSFAPGIMNFLVRLGHDETEIQGYYSKNVQFVTEGYAASYHEKLNFPLFSPVLLMDNTEFIRIHGRLERLRGATTTPGDTRENLRNAWIELLKRHVGVDRETEYEEITLQQASSMVFGVPLRAGMLDIPLRDITDTSVFNDRMLSRYINHIVFKFNELDRIANKPDYRFAFMSNDIRYYWIDIDLLP